MASIAFVWELGGGMGHLARLAPIAAFLRERGHRVSLVARDRSHADRLFAGVECVQAPTAAVPPGLRIREPASYAEILFNAGCCDHATLAELVAAWQRLFDALQPDVAVLDYAPLALLALQGRACATVLLGTGFASPPDISPLPDLRPWQDHYPDRLLMNELQVLESINEQLTRSRERPLERLAALAGRANLNLLTSFPELDHYPQRRALSSCSQERGAGFEYVGTWSDAGGVAPEWPHAGGARVFAYLKPFPALPQLLRELAQRATCSLVYVAGKDPRLADLAPPGSLRIVDAPIHIQRAAREADVAILNAGHGATAEMLLAGTPILEIPLLVEQAMVARNVERLGAGLCAALDDPVAIAAALDRLLAEDRWRAAAQRFAYRWRNHDPNRAVVEVAERIEALVGSRTFR